MKLVKTLLATTLALTAFSTFAAKHKAPAAEEKAEAEVKVEEPKPVKKVTKKAMYDVLM